MSTFASSANLPCRQVAEQILSAQFGDKIILDAGIIIGDRSHLHRFHILDGPSSAPATVVVKEANLFDEFAYDPNTSFGPSVQLFDEWAGLQLLTRIAAEQQLGPRCYGGDREAGILVLEDLAGVTPLDLLQGSDAAQAETVLVVLAKTLGKLHVHTGGQQALFAEIRNPLGPRGGETDVHGYFYGYEWLHTALHPALESLSLTLSPEAESELRQLVALFEDPGDLLVYTHNDSCPDNSLYADGVLRLIDFERGFFRHALLDAVVGRMDFPTCWCANHIPRTVTQRMEVAYRTELAKGYPAAGDDQTFDRGLVAACAYWTLSMMQRYEIPTLIHQDDQWGLATLRQRLLHRSRIFVATTTEFGHFEALGEAVAKICLQLQTKWGAAIAELPPYPAFCALHTDFSL